MLAHMVKIAGGISAAGADGSSACSFGGRSRQTTVQNILI
jgi:hypothetical protein